MYAIISIYSKISPIACSILNSVFFLAKYKRQNIDRRLDAHICLIILHREYYHMRDAHT